MNSEGSLWKQLEQLNAGIETETDAICMSCMSSKRRGTTGVRCACWPLALLNLSMRSRAPSGR